MARAKAREAAMQLVFEQLFGGAGEDTLVDLIGFEPDDADRHYIDEMVSGCATHATELDAQIAANLRGWTLQRISRVDHAILRLAAYEMLYAGIQAPVVINEAVELTRKYSQDNSCSFVNGVLGSINRKRAQA